MNIAFIVVIVVLALVAGYFWGVNHTFDALLNNLAKGKF